MNLDGGKVTVVAPLEGAPADRAGILPGDNVVAVNDVPVDADDVEASVSRMRGAPGTEVTLDVLRPGSEAPLHFALTRSRGPRQDGAQRVPGQRSRLPAFVVVLGKHGGGSRAGGA